MRDELAMDNVFIASYWLLFGGLCVLLAGRGFKRRVWRFEWPYGLWLAIVAAVCVTGAAVTDTVENAHIATLLDATALTQQFTKMLGTAGVPEVMKQLAAAGVPGGTMRLVMNVAEASFQKWTLIALATLALWPVFLWRGGWLARLFGAVLSLLYLVAGALMLWGALGGHAQFIVAGFKTLIAGSGVIAFVFTLKPEWVAGVS